MIRAARIFAPISTSRLAFVDALIATGVFVALVRWATSVDPWVYFFETEGAAHLAPLILILVSSMYFVGLYEHKRIESRIYLAQQLAVAGGVSLISQGVTSYIYEPWALPRDVSFYGLLCCILVLFLWRLLRDAILARLDGEGTILILGTDATAHRIAQFVSGHIAHHLKVAGTLTNRPERAVQPVLGGVANLRDVARSLRPDMIVSGLADARDVMPIAEMLDLRYAGTRIEEAGAACEVICRSVSARDLRPSRMLFSGDFDGGDPPLVFPTADILTSALLLVIGAPFALLYWLLLQLSGRGPAIVKEACAGYQGRPFLSREFRVADSGGLAVLVRGLSLQHWPQLWNVLAGRMSMVGPRAQRLEMASELGRLLPVHEYRRNIQPGITGWAQINLTHNPELSDAIAEVEYDLYYVRNRSFRLYAYILLYGLRRAS